MEFEILIFDVLREGLLKLYLFFQKDQNNLSSFISIIWNNQLHLLVIGLRRPLKLSLQFQNSEFDRLSLKSSASKPINPRNAKQYSEKLEPSFYLNICHWQPLQVNKYMAFKFVFGNTLLILLTHFLSISGNIYWRGNKCAYNWSFLLHTGMELSFINDLNLLSYCFSLPREESGPWSPVLLVQELFFQSCRMVGQPTSLQKPLHRNPNSKNHEPASPRILTSCCHLSHQPCLSAGTFN